MADSPDNSFLSDKDRSQATDEIQDFLDDSDLTLPPYPEDLPSPLNDQESQLSSPLDDIHNLDYEKKAQSVYAANKPDGHLNFSDQFSIQAPKSNPADGINLTLTQPERHDGNGSVSTQSAMDTSSNDQEDRSLNEVIQNQGQRESTANRQKGHSGPTDTTICQTTNTPETESDLNGRIKNGKGNPCVIPISSDDLSKGEREVSMQNNDVLVHQVQKTSPLKIPGESNELWPPVPDLTDVDMDISAQLGELDKFCREYGNSERDDEEILQYSDALTSKPATGGNGRSRELKGGAKSFHVPTQELHDAGIPIQHAVDSKPVGFSTQHVDAELTVPHMSQDDPPDTQYGKRDLSIPLKSTDNAKPDLGILGMGQRRRERYALTKSPFWKQSADSESSIRKAETPMAADLLCNTPDNKDDKEFYDNVPESYGNGNGNAAQKGPSKPMDDAPIISNDFIIIKVGRDHDSRTERKLAEIVNELKKLSSLDETQTDAKEQRIVDNRPWDEISTLPSHKNAGMNNSSTGLESVQRGKPNFTTMTSGVISDNRNKKYSRQTSSQGFVHPMQDNKASRLKRGVSLQNGAQTKDRHDFRHLNRPFVSSSLTQLATNPQVSPNGFDPPHHQKQERHSGDCTPSSDYDNDTPKPKVILRNGHYERFDLKRDRPHSDEISSSQRLRKFLNFTNGTNGHDLGPEKLGTSFPQNGSLEFARHLQQAEDQEKGEAGTKVIRGLTNDAFEDESQLSGDDLVNELLRLSGKNAGATSVSTVDSADESETPVDETTPLYGNNQHRRQRSVAFFDPRGKDKTVDFDSICEEVDETCPLRGTSEHSDSDDRSPDDYDQSGDEFNNEDFDNLSLEFVVPGSKRHIRLHRKTFINFILKYAIFLFSFLFWALSLTGITFGMLMLTQQTVVFDNAADVMLDPYVLLCMMGGIIFLIAFLGCIGALRENVLLLKMFHLSLTVVLVMEGLLTALIFIFYTLPEFRRAAKVGPEEILKKAVLRYFDDEAMKNWIDSLQKEFKCCGVSLRDNGYLDWTENQYFNCSTSNPSVYRCSVPLSCCIFEKGDYINYMCGMGIINKEQSYVKRYIHTKGCMMSFGEWLADNTTIIAYVGLAFFIPQILGVVAARFFIKNIQKQSKVPEEELEEEDHELSDIEESQPVAGASASPAVAIPIPSSSNDAETDF